MKAKLLTQIAPENRLLNRIGPEAKNAVSVVVAVSFIQKSGMKHLFQKLKPLFEKNHAVTIFTSGYLGITDPLALDDLLRLTSHYPSVKAYFNLDDRFHSKFLLFDKPKGTYGLFLGSSNISVEGLAATGELNIHVRGQKADQVYKDIRIVIDNLSKNQAFEELTDTLIEKYKKQRRKRTVNRPTQGRRHRRLVLPLEKMTVYVIRQEFTAKEQSRIEEKHPHWKTYVSYQDQLRALNGNEHFLCITQQRGKKATFTVSEFLEHDRIDGVGTVAHTKDGKSFSLKRLADKLKITEKALLGMKYLDIYEIAIMRRDFQDAIG